MILYILWINTIYSRFSSPFLPVVGQCHSLKWHVAKHGSVLGLEGLVENTHSWNTTVLLYFQTDHCSKQCWGIAWAAEPLKVKKKHLDFSWWEVRVNVSDFLIWGGAKSLQWFLSVWSQPINDYIQCLFYVIIIPQHNATWPKIKR